MELSLQQVEFFLFNPSYLIQCDVCGMHKCLSMDSVWEKEIKKWIYI